jgi:4-hydroxy-tetrahydrodipicolinate reductase
MRRKKNGLDGLRVIVYGVGAMGSNMVRLLQGKKGCRIVGAIDWDEKKIGRDLGEVAGLDKKLGVKVAYPPDEVLGRVEADVALHATTAFLDEAAGQIRRVLEHGIDVVTICQELFFPLPKNALRAKGIQTKAIQTGTRVTAVGINPGFIMDILPILGSTPCWSVDSVSVRRNVDFSPYGPSEMQHIGANLTEREFREGVRQGTIGHIGLLETAAMVAHCLGLAVDELRQSKEPLLTAKKRQTPFVSIAPGRVYGFKQNVAGLAKGRKILDFQMVGLVAPDMEEDGIELGDYARINGVPNVDIVVKEEISQKGGLGTAAVAVNTIPRLLAAPPGYHRMDTLALPHIWRGSAAVRPAAKIVYQASE